MLCMPGLLTATLFLGAAVPPFTGGEVPPQTLDALGLSGMTVIIVEPEVRWTPWSPPPVYAPYNVVRPQPGVRYYTRPTATYLNRRLTNFR